MTPQNSSESFAEVAARVLDKALGAMNEAVRITSEEGPAAGMEYIADYLSNTDGVDEAIADALPDNWLTKWTVGLCVGG